MLNGFFYLRKIDKKIESKKTFRLYFYILLVIRLDNQHCVTV